MRSIGIDQSLTNTGLVVTRRTYKVLRGDAIVVKPLVVHHELIRTKPDADQPYDLQVRIALILDRVAAVLKRYRPEHIVLEGHGFHAASGTDTRSVELVGALKLFLYQQDYLFTLRTPGEVKKLATGKGNCDKKAMQAACAREGFEPGAKNHNVADAYWLARTAWT